MAMSRERPTPKAQQTRSRILISALELFRERGFEETSMRDIAERAGTSVGSTYYYFRTKDELVLEYYRQTQRESEERARSVFAKTEDFEERLRDVVSFKLEQLRPARNLVVVLARNAVDPCSPLSPFGAETEDVRERAIGILDEAIEGSDLDVSRPLRPYLPLLLWFFQMGLIFLWIHDPSERQRLTRRVVGGSIPLLLTLLRLSSSRLPGVSKINRQVIDLLDMLSEELAESPAEG